jgi:hypothetical protein
MPEAPDDFLDDLIRRADELVPQLLAQLEEAARDGGKRTVRFKCSSCGRGNAETIDYRDPEQTRKLIETMSSIKLRVRAAQKDEVATTGATKLLRDRSELGEVELAEYIARLEAELAAETTPVDRELVDVIESLDQEQRVALLAHVRGQRP